MPTPSRTTTPPPPASHRWRRRRVARSATGGTAPSGAKAPEPAGAARGTRRGDPDVGGRDGPRRLAGPTSGDTVPDGQVGRRRRLLLAVGGRGGERHRHLGRLRGGRLLLGGAL